MIKIVVLIKKRADMTTEQFRAYYEDSHTAHALRHLGHLFVEYRRNYPVFTARVDGKNVEGSTDRLAYDVITEIVLRDQAALDEYFRILNQPDVSKFLNEDVEKFADSAASWFTICEVEQHKDSAR